jgi:hypothetical protein
MGEPVEQSGSEVFGAEHLGPVDTRQDMIQSRILTIAQRVSGWDSVSKATGKLEGPRSACTSTAANTPGSCF